jgi:hypothetical protein
VRGEQRSPTGVLSNADLSLRLSDHLAAHLPRPDSTSGRPLDVALVHLKTVRDRGIAHHDRVSHSALLIPAWGRLVELIDYARATVEMVGVAYLRIGYSLTSDAKAAAVSLRRLLKTAGLNDGANREKPPSG